MMPLVCSFTQVLSVCSKRKDIGGGGCTEIFPFILSVSEVAGLPHLSLHRHRGSTRVLNVLNFSRFEFFLKEITVFCFLTSGLSAEEVTLFTTLLHQRKGST